MADPATTLRTSGDGVVGAITPENSTPPVATVPNPNGDNEAGNLLDQTINGLTSNITDLTNNPDGIAGAITNVLEAIKPLAEIAERILPIIISALGDDSKIGQVLQEMLNFLQQEEVKAEIKNENLSESNARSIVSIAGNLKDAVVEKEGSDDNDKPILNFLEKIPGLGDLLGKVIAAFTKLFDILNIFDKDDDESAEGTGATEGTGNDVAVVEEASDNPIADIIGTFTSALNGGKIGDLLPDLDEVMGQNALAGVTNVIGSLFGREDAEPNMDERKNMLLALFDDITGNVIPNLKEDDDKKKPLLDLFNSLRDNLNANSEDESMIQTILFTVVDLLKDMMPESAQGVLNDAMKLLMKEESNIFMGAMNAIAEQVGIQDDSMIGELKGQFEGMLGKLTEGPLTKDNMLDLTAFVKEAREKILGKANLDNIVDLDGDTKTNFLGRIFSGSVWNKVFGRDDETSTESSESNEEESEGRIHKFFDKIFG